MQATHILAAVAAFGSLVALGLLMRNLVGCPALIRNSDHPEYTRFSCNMSHVVSGSVVLLWGLAAWSAWNLNGFQIALLLMFSPILVMFPMMSVTKRWQLKHADLVPESFREVGEKARELKALRDVGGLSDSQLAAEILKLQWEMRQQAKLGQRKPITSTPDRPD